MRKQENVSHRAAKFYSLNLQNDISFQTELNFNFFTKSIKFKITTTFIRTGAL